MGNPGPTTDRSSSVALVRKIIRKVNMGRVPTNRSQPQQQAYGPKQLAYVNTSMGTIIRFKKWRTATQLSCLRPGGVAQGCVKDGKKTGNCGC